MNAHEKAYRQLIGRGFCHFSSSQLDEYVYKARWRMGLAAVLAAGAVLAYVLAVRPF
jgi:hypothetical protein